MVMKKAEKKVMVSLMLDGDVLGELDDFADAMGLSRSATGNLILKAALTQDYGELMASAAKAVKTRGKARKANGNVLETVQ